MQSTNSCYIETGKPAVEWIGLLCEVNKSIGEIVYEFFKLFYLKKARVESYNVLIISTSSFSTAFMLAFLTIIFRPKLRKENAAMAQNAITPVIGEK